VAIAAKPNPENAGAKRSGDMPERVGARTYLLRGRFALVPQVTNAAGIPMCMGRISFGIALVVAAVLFGYLQLQRASTQTDRDFAACQSASVDCESQERPITILATGSSAAGQPEYELTVQIGPNSTFSFYGLTESDVAELQRAGVSTMPVYYRQGRAVAIATPDGSAVAVPFSFFKTLLWVVLLSGLTALVGVVVGISGLVRAVRLTPAY
jgi:hypothetical protein